MYCIRPDPLRANVWLRETSIIYGHIRIHVHTWNYCAEGGRVWEQDYIASSSTSELKTGMTRQSRTKNF